jgi:hypothetical protein
MHLLDSLLYFLQQFDHTVQHVVSGPPDHPAVANSFSKSSVSIELFFHGGISKYVPTMLCVFSPSVIPALQALSSSMGTSSLYPLLVLSFHRMYSSSRLTNLGPPQPSLMAILFLLGALSTTCILLHW